MEAERKARFWAKVVVKSENECWLWTATVNSKGYGSFAVSPGKSASAHKVSWAMHYNNDVLPDSKNHVMHSCDIRRCVNPKHLSLGTAKDNVRDAINKGRMKITRPSLNDFCKAGHPRTPENTHPKYFTCILCSRKANAESKQRERERDREKYNAYHREYYRRNKGEN